MNPSSVMMRKYRDIRILELISILGGIWKPTYVEKEGFKIILLKSITEATS